MKPSDRQGTPSPPASDPAAQAPTPRTAAPPASGEGTSQAGQRILVVDDNAANLRLLAFLLEKKGYTVRTADDAPSALALLAQWRPRLILLDIQLPGMGGLELASKLKADPDTRDILIVAVTAFAMKGDDERALAAGCDSYVTKPIDTRGLPALVAELLAR